MKVLASGPLEKMLTTEGDEVGYELPVGDDLIAMNELLGSVIQLRFLARITCQNCGRTTSKSFDQGYCYPCFSKLAACDTCIMSPERCHFAQGTCREPAWGTTFCMQPHVVYLANSAGLKVGITRHTQVPTRWMDQGAVAARPIFEVDTRQQSGFVEALYRSEVSDRTAWQRMLKGNPEPIDLDAEAARLLALLGPGVAELKTRFGDAAIRPLNDAATRHFAYPVRQWPSKVVSLNLDKQPIIEGRLQGIKGQYLMLDTGCINARKFTSYHVEVAVH